VIISKKEGGKQRGKVLALGPTGTGPRAQEYNIKDLNNQKNVTRDWYN